MRKVFAVILFCVCLSSIASADVVINAINFPDANFRAYVATFDTDSNDTLTTSELAAVTSIDVKAKSISSLQGIEHFTAIISLDCSENKIKTLNLNSNTSLTFIDVSAQNDEVDALIETGVTSYPYRLNIDALSFNLSDLTNIRNVKVFDEAGNEIDYTSGLFLNFASKPKTLQYEYDTKAPVANSYMSVTVTLSDFSETTDTSSNEWRYQFSIPSGLMDAVVSDFKLDTSNSVFQLTDNEFTEWTLSDDSEISNIGERVVFTLPQITPNNSGVYIMRYYLGETAAGLQLNLHRIANTSQDIEYSFYDNNGRVISAVPSDKIIYLAMRTTAEQEYRFVITNQVTSTVENVEVIPLVSQDKLSEAIASALAINESEVNFVNSNQISEAKALPKEIEEAISSDNYELVHQLAKVSVDKPGYYAFKVTLPDDVYNELKDVDIKDIRLYGIIDEKEVSLNPSAVDPVSKFLLVTLEGIALTALVTEFVVVSYVMYPTSFYIARPHKTVVVHEHHHDDDGCGDNATAALIIVGGLIILKFVGM